MVKEKFHIGTSGFSYKHWKEIFYPPGTKPADYLSFYAQTFKVTELNTSFYHLPRAKTIEGWMNKVPPDFKFCVKLSRFITHMKRLLEPEEPLKKFFDIFKPLQQQMGPVLVQLPPSFKYDSERATHFFDVLNTDYSAYEFVLEPRHETWLHDESLHLLSKYNIGFVISQSGVRFPYAEHATAKNIYIRFHGPTELYRSSYDDDTLKDFAALIKKQITNGHEVWAFFNNDVHGYALPNSLKLIELLRTK